MKPSKGISPLIASVLLIAFTMSIALVAGPFFTNTLQNTQEDTNEKAKNLVSASQMSLKIASAKYNQTSSNLSVTLQNSGSSAVENLSLTVFGSQPYQQSFNNRLKPREVKQLQIHTEEPWNLKEIQASLQNYPVSTTRQVRRQYSNQIEFMELGAIRTGDSWKTVELQEQYNSPVIAATIIEEGNSLPVAVRVKDVTSSSFDVKLSVANQTGTATQDLVSYLVAEEGAHTLPDGTQIEAQRYIEYNTTGRSCDSSSSSHTFSTSFSSAPIVLDQLMSYNDSRHATAHEWSISNSGFNAAMEAAEACEAGIYTKHDPELYGWIAIEATSSQINGVQFETQNLPDEVRGHSNDCYNPNIEQKYSSPLGLAEWRGRDGGDGGWYSVCNRNAFGVHIEEDILNDNDRGHTDTRGAMMVFSEISKVSLK